MKITITIRNLQNKIPINPKRIKEALLRVLSKEGTQKSGEVTVCFVDDLKIRRLNKKYLHKNLPTDVLAFDASDRKGWRGMFADIFISTDMAVRNAVDFKTSVSYELNLYLVHAVLHLLGYDDKTARQRKIMERKSSRILAAMGVK